MTGHIDTSPAASLAALEALRRTVLLVNRGRPIAARSVWIRDGAALAPREVERRYAVAIADRGPLELPSDTYVCMGAATLGSGRSVFVGGMQVKGVGRTAHAPPLAHPRVTDGRLAVDRVVRAIHGSAIVRELSALPQIPHDFALLVPRARGEREDFFLLGRQGSPLRLGHLHYLRGALCVKPYFTRIVLWRQLVNRFVGRTGDGLELDDVHALFDAIVDHAMLALAEARLFGLTDASWHDNADLFTRVFDTEDVEFHFGRPLRPPLGRHVVRPGETARLYFTRTTFATNANVMRDAYTCSLQYLQNALLAIEHIAEGVTYELRALDRRYGWAALRARYRDALARVLARWLAVAPAPATAAARELARQLPFVPEASSRPFAPRDLLIGLRDRKGRTAGATIGARLARHSAVTPERAERMLDGLDAERLVRERARFVARADAIERRGAAHRIAEYRTLLREVERAACAVRPGASNQQGD
ncbi:MAG TPA: hypothetical protein VLX92_22045 [Kofleriaceae bacterium]|nr:hypothetical protein [Kofleriaceae bacterium]